MTTFQDPPPHSRRAVRQSERGETAAATPAEGTPYTFDPASEGAASAPQSTAAPVAPPSGRRAQLPAATHYEQYPGFEPLTYSTQGRVAPPSDELAAQQHPASAPAPLPSAPQAAVPLPVSAQLPGAQPSTPQPSPSDSDSAFRVRDFSPEGGRRALRQALGAPLTTSSSYPGPSQVPQVDLDYHTQAAAPAHVASPPSQLDDGLNHTLTRRELREMRAAAEQQAPPLQLPEPIDTLLNSGPIQIPSLAPPPGQSQALAEAMAEFDMLTRARREAESRARDAQVASLATPIVPVQQPAVQQAPVHPQPPVQAQPPVQEQPSQPPVQQQPVQQPPVQQPPVLQQPMPQQPVQLVPPTAEPSAPQAPVAPPHLVFPPVSVAEPVLEAEVVDSAVVDAAAAPPRVVAASAPQPIEPTPVATAPSAAPAAAQQTAPQPSVLTTPVFTTPVFSDAPSVQDAEQDEHGGRSPRASNHWRVQAAKEDEGLPLDSTLSRTVGSNTSAITTSALVLPSVPQPDGILTSLTSTGEILVTGSINLPRSLGSTGAHPDRVDHADDEDDPLDSQVAAPDSAPVRAIRAVSTSTSTRGVIETKRPQGNRMLTGVIIAASVLCVGLVGLLVFAFATGKL